MAPRGSASQKAAQQQAENLRSLVLKHYNVRGQSTHTRHKHNTFGEVWQAKLEPAPNVRVKVASGDLVGVWTVTSYWRYAADPKDASEVILVDSSVGLNVSELPPDHPLHDPMVNEPICLVRYDYDLDDDRPHHLNVRQAGPLADHVHWRLPLDTPTVEPLWNAESVFAWLAGGSIPGDLSRRCRWPVV